MIYVCNSTSIIAFARLGRLDILHNLFGCITIPTAVEHELVGYGLERVGASDVIQADWVQIENVQNTDYVNFLTTTLEHGEAEVIALAYEKRADLTILDEKIARRVAKHLCKCKKG